MSQPFPPLLIFAKAPEPGLVKTRLITALGAEGAQQVYLQLLERTLSQTQDWPGERWLYCAPDCTHAFFAQAADRHRLELRQQSEGDLGERMFNALSKHPSGALLIGSDCPELDTEQLTRAAEALNDHDVAVLPSEDGGYVMIGQRRPHPAPFDNMSWSHADVFEHTRQRAAAAGLSLWVGPTLWDVDEPGDLVRFRALDQAHRAKDDIPSA